jgi:hypothetical protein
MKRLLWRVLVVCVVLVVSCAGVVLIARANPTPDPLQALGFDVCDGEPCWRGVKPGMPWATVRAMFPKGRVGTSTLGQPHLMIDINSAESSHAYLYSDGATIERIVIWRDQFPLAVTPGEIVARYGSPRCVVIGGFNSVPIFDATMLYATLRVSSHLPYSYERAQQRYSFRVALDVPVQSLSFQRGAGGVCAGQSVFVLPWRGFQVKVLQ